MSFRNIFFLLFSAIGALLWKLPVMTPFQGFLILLPSLAALFLKKLFEFEIHYERPGGRWEKFLLGLFCLAWLGPWLIAFLL
jgi:hypothetical protein